MDIAALEKLIGTERDGALLRLSLAKLLVREDDLQSAENHLLEATRMQADYSAAWKELGRVRLARDNPAGARDAWRRGLDAARAQGDKQAQKEMQVFLRRLEKQNR